MLMLCLQILERISFLLRSVEHQSACTPLLAVLSAYARAGTDTARAVWQCPGMQQGLIKLLRNSWEEHDHSVAANVLAVIRQIGSVSQQLMQAVTSSGKHNMLLQRVVCKMAAHSHPLTNQTSRWWYMSNVCTHSAIW